MSDYKHQKKKKHIKNMKKRENKKYRHTEREMLRKYKCTQKYKAEDRHQIHTHTHTYTNTHIHIRIICLLKVRTIYSLSRRVYIFSSKYARRKILNSFSHGESLNGTYSMAHFHRERELHKGGQ